MMVEEYELKNVACRMVAILSVPPCVNEAPVYVTLRSHLIWWWLRILNSLTVGWYEGVKYGIFNIWNVISFTEFDLNVIDFSLS